MTLSIEVILSKKKALFKINSKYSLLKEFVYSFVGESKILRFNFSFPFEQIFKFLFLFPIKTNYFPFLGSKKILFSVYETQT